tara:strand:- start:10 stop:450 length:441 start_codon:yes stop_codon:yes gene_type:complete
MGRKKGERKPGSWRDKGQGECFTRSNKSGATYVVCDDPPRGSKGQKGVYKTKTQKKQKEDVGTQVKLKKVEKINKDIKKAEKQLELQKDRITKIRIVAMKKENKGEKLSRPQQEIRDKPVSQAKSVLKFKDKIDKLKEERRAVKKN